MRKKSGSIQNRGSSFRISYYDVNHLRQYESFKTEEQALGELAKRLAEVAQGIPISSRPSTILFGELCADVVNDYLVNQRKSVDDIEMRFRLHILPVFGLRKAVQITTAQLNAYILRRHAEAQKPAVGTINRELEAIRHAFRLALQGRKILTMPHVPHLKESNTRSGFFSRAEVDRLCSHLPRPLDAFVLFAFLTGWRLEEIRSLQWRNVDFEAGEIRLDPGTTKNGEGRIFPMSPELRTLLDNLKAGAAIPHAARVASIRSVLGNGVPAQKTLQPYVFSVEGRRPIGEFRKTWKTACYKAGLPCVVEPITIRGHVQRNKDGSPKVRAVRSLRIFHDLRRSAARELQRQGFTEGQIMRLMGHKTRSMFDRYQIVTDDDLREKMKGLDQSKHKTS